MVLAQRAEASLRQLTDDDDLENPGGGGRFFQLLEMSASQVSGEREIP
jgi:hypothetical protein